LQELKEMEGERGNMKKKKFKKRDGRPSSAD